MEEVGQGVNTIDGNDGGGGGNTVTFMGRAGAIERAGVVPGVVRTVEKVLDDLVGGSDVELVSVVKLGPRGGRKGRGGNDSGGEQRRQH